MEPKKDAIIEIVTDIPWERPHNETGDYTYYKDMCLVRVTNGQGRFIDGVNHLGPENGGVLYRAVLLDGKPLIQMRDTERPGDYGYGKIAPGVGLEHVNCAEMRQVDEAFRCGNPYRGFHDAFEKLKPFFSLLNDGYYILADTLMCPTDGGSRIFWDVGGSPQESPAFNRRMDFFDSASSAQHPRYLYPSKWPSYYSEEALERFDSGTFTAGEKPRAVCYAVSSTMALLLDGHYKAIDHMEYSELVPALLIVPHMKDRENFGTAYSFFADVKFRADSLNSTPVFVPIHSTDFVFYPVKRRGFETNRHTLEKRWMLYPHVGVFYSEILSFLADNAAKLIRYDADISDAVYQRPDKSQSCKSGK